MASLTRFGPILLGAATLFSGCVTIGPKQLKVDQVDYARALGDAKKREILSAMIELRYADAPAFLNLSQVITAYTWDATGGATLNSRPDPGGALIQGTGTLSYSDHPTFTFSPETGEAYANAFIRPLPPELVLPLAESGIPIDLLLRITAQSIGDLHNATMLGGDNGNGSPGFFELLRLLRELQLAGLLTFQSKTVNQASHMYLSLGKVAAPNANTLNAAEARVRELLQLPPSTTDYEIVAARNAVPTGQVAITTRSVLGILSNLGAEIDVPAEDVSRGATKPTLQLVGGETRPTIIVHTGKASDAQTYATVTYHGVRYWIDAGDFDSKYAFTIVQNLMALAEANDLTRAPVVTIPAS